MSARLEEAHSRGQISETNEDFFSLMSGWALPLFRRLMRAISKLPDERRQQARVSCRSEFRLGSGLTEEAAKKKAQKSLEYVQMLTPKQKGKAGRYVIRDGELVQEDMSKSVKRGGVLVKNESGITPEHLDRHMKLLRRQHFLDRK